MKYASAMRYGGELIDAAECNYDDYNYLKPLCPNCKDSVFLRKEFDRTRNDKTSTVPAHWSHFPGRDPALVSQCELRVSQYTADELKRRSTQARNQRLKLFQRWFWTIIKNLPFSHHEGEILGNIIEPHWEIYDHFPPYREYSDELCKAIVGVLKTPGFLSSHVSRLSNVPNLTLKERLYVDAHLPNSEAEDIQKDLGFLFDEDEHISFEMLKTYILFYRQSPYFSRVFF